MHKYFVCLVVAAILSCGKKSAPSDVLSQTEMVTIITEIQLADAAFKLDMLPEKYKTNPQSYFLEILAQHQTDSAVYNRSLAYYAEDQSALKKIYQQVEKNIQQK